jgi:hypothetical protein
MTHGLSVAVSRVIVTVVFVATGCDSTRSDRASVLTFVNPEFGSVAHRSGSESRTVIVRNSDASAVSISRWEVSCECLSVEPESLVVPALGEAVIQLRFDPDKEGDLFIGDLIISVEAFCVEFSVASFLVPLSVTAAEAQRP